MIFGSAERTSGLCRIVEYEPMSLTVWILTRLHQVGGLDQSVFPFISSRTLHGIMKSVDEGAVKQFLQIRTAYSVGAFHDIPLRKLRRSQIIDLGTVALIRRMFYEESLGSHREFLILGGIEVVDLPSAQRMTVEKIHIDQDSQRMAVGLDARQLLGRVSKLQRTRLKHLRSDEIGRSNYVWRIFPRDHQTITVNDGGPPAFRINEYIFI